MFLAGGGTVATRIPDPVRPDGSGMLRTQSLAVSLLVGVVRAFLEGGGTVTTWIPDSGRNTFPFPGTVRLPESVSACVRHLLDSEGGSRVSVFGKRPVSDPGRVCRVPDTRTEVISQTSNIFEGSSQSNCERSRTAAHLSLIRLFLFWRRRMVGTFRTVIRSSSRQNGMFPIFHAVLPECSVGGLACLQRDRPHRNKPGTFQIQCSTGDILYAIYTKCESFGYVVNRIFSQRSWSRFPGQPESAHLCRPLDRRTFGPLESPIRHPFEPSQIRTCRRPGISPR